MKHTLEQLKKAEDRLPKNIKEAISSIDLIYAVQNISKEYNLHIDKIGELSDEISFVMLGLTHSTDFVKNIKRRLEIDEGAAHAIAKEVNEKIFNPIKESLLSLHSDKNTLIPEEISRIKNANEQKKETESLPKARQVSIKENSDIPNKKDILKEIEYQPIVSTAPINDEDIKRVKKQGDIIDEKLDGEFGMPKEETEIKVSENSIKKKPVHQDPYRENIE